MRPQVEFGRRVRHYRAQQQISQEELADRAALDRTYMSSIERGKRNVRLENICRIARALNVDRPSWCASSCPRRSG